MGDYCLFFNACAFTITGGRLGDLFGRKKMFVAGAIIFAVGSFMTSIAQSVGFMILGEAIIEGIGACLMLPATCRYYVQIIKDEICKLPLVFGVELLLGPRLGSGYWRLVYNSLHVALGISGQCFCCCTLSSSVSIY